MANVTVANTTANLSGKTIVLAERDTTITGLETFDRDPSAPFAVTASSAVVANLDADKLDGVEGSGYVNKTVDAIWTPYTPAWTASVNPALGDGSKVGGYLQLGKLVFFYISIAMGSTTTYGTGSWAFSLPVTASIALGGSAVLLDQGVGFFSATPVLVSSTTIGLIPPAGGGVEASTPFVWADTDTLNITGFYKAA